MGCGQGMRVQIGQDFALRPISQRIDFDAQAIEFKAVHQLRCPV